MLIAHCITVVILSIATLLRFESSINWSNQLFQRVSQKRETLPFLIAQQKNDICFDMKTANYTPSCLISITVEISTWYVRALSAIMSNTLSLHFLPHPMLPATN